MIKHCTSPSFELKHYLDLDLIDAQISSTVCAAGQEHLEGLCQFDQHKRYIWRENLRD